MSQDQDTEKADIWDWRTDHNGRVTSISSGFAVFFGAQAHKKIINNHFWTFADGTEEPSSSWDQLNIALKEHTKIRKFIFHYDFQGQTIKVAVNGEPIFDQNRYMGHRGKIYVAGKNEISITEITQNIATTAIYDLKIGIAIFSQQDGLLEFNQHFIDQMALAKANVSRHMTYQNLISTLKSRNEYLEGLSQDEAEHIKLYFKQHNQIILSIKKVSQSDDQFIIQSEQDTSLTAAVKNYEKTIDKAEKDYKILENHIEQYKEQLSKFINKKEPVHHNYNNVSSDQSADVNKMLEFYTNNLDVGILITDVNGKPEKANYYAAQIFGFVTATLLLVDKNNKEFNQYISNHITRIEELISNSINRFETSLAVENNFYSGEFKEVITFYPSIHNPQKVITLFYPYNNYTNEVISQDSEVHDNKDYEQFIHYMIDDIKTAVTVINGYNDLNAAVSNEKTNNYNAQINDSCEQILESISDVMQVYKVSSQLQNLEQTIFSLNEALYHCLNHPQIRDIKKYISFDLSKYDENLLIMADKELFYSALEKLILVMKYASNKESNLKVYAIEDTEKQSLRIIVEDQSPLNIAQICNATVSEVFTNPQLRSTGGMNFKIAECYLTLQNCHVQAHHEKEKGNVVMITFGPEAIVNQNKRDGNEIRI